MIVEVAGAALAPTTIAVLHGRYPSCRYDGGQSAFLAELAEVRYFLIPLAFVLLLEERAAGRDGA